jgi:hypothetical protein
MTTYNEIAGRRVNFLSSDPTYVDTNSDGQVWYNSSTATLKSWLPTGAFSAGGNMNTTRAYPGSANSGTQLAALAFAGTTGVPSSASEAYNGIAWTSTSSLNTQRLDEIYIDPHIKKGNFFLIYGDITDSLSVFKIIKKIQPNEIYNLAAQSHVGVSFQIPEYTANVDAIGSLRILDSIKIKQSQLHF